MNARGRISRDGGVVIPQALREAYGWGAETELEFVESSSGLVLRAIQKRNEQDVQAAIDAFLAAVPKVVGAPLTEQEIDRLLEEEAVRRFDATFD